jgi:HlyD family secretion protein
MMSLGVRLALVFSFASIATVLVPANLAANTEIRTIRVSAPGRLIGASEALELSFAAPGRIEVVAVTAGQKVHRGDLLATVDCSPDVSRRTALAAEMMALESARDRLLAVARSEARLVSDARVQTAQAQLLALQHRLTRIQQLRSHGGSVAASEAELEEAADRVDVAQHELDSARADLALVNASARREDIQEADAKINAQRAIMNSLDAQLGQCELRAPIDGTVLKVLREAGETISTFIPQPVLVLADMSHRRVRVEVDERDVDAVRVGQAVTIVSDSRSDLRAMGQVTAADAQMGRRHTRTLDPSDKSDRDILEVLVSVGSEMEALPVGYRVTAVFD